MSGWRSGSSVETELEGLLDGHEPLAGWDLGGECPQQGRLPRVHGSGHHDVLPGSNGRTQERGQGFIHGSEVDEIVERELGVPMPSDGDGRPNGHRHESGEATAIRKPQVELRPRHVEAALRETEPARRRFHQVDQLFVGVGDRLGKLLRPVGICHPDTVTTVDVDVLDVAGHR